VPYRAWRDIFFAFFKLTQGVSPSQVWQQAAQLVPDLEDYFPLLNEVLSVHFPENGLTAVLDPARRQESLAYLWQSLLHVTASTRPVVLIFENAQWLDARSWELVAATATAAASYRIFLVLVMRPFADSSRCLEFTARPETPPTEYLRLETLPADDTLAIVAASLGLTGHELPEGLSELLRNRAAGNPFFAEELFHTLRQNGFVTLKEMQATQRCLVTDDLNRVAQMLPATIENTILARIDQLRPGAQLTLKVAAVIGQAFAFSTLRDILQSHLNVSESALTSYLDDLTYLGFIQPASPEPDASFVLKTPSPAK
jgi:predicted ATPase